MEKWYEKPFSGEETLVLNGEQTDYSILQFWQSTFSVILLNMTRGSFAEFIVRCALDRGGFDAFSEIKNGTESFDITGPEIPTLNRSSRIEVKSAASVQLTTPDEKEPISLPESQLRFSIRPAIDWNHEEKGAKRNNDLYVFCHYTATRKSDNMLDLGLWKFYLLPTCRIEQYKAICKQKTISITRLKQLGITPCTFEELCDRIILELSAISG